MRPIRPLLIAALLAGCGVPGAPERPADTRPLPRPLAADAPVSDAGLVISGTASIGVVGS